jgi:TolB-like protein/tetratricopeptide (TPR) repeat protein
MRGLFEELKRRNVLRAAALYIAAVWALAQGIAQLGPSVGAPEWVTRWFLVAAIVGFPLWIAFAWFFEFTPAGLKRESETDEPHPGSRRIDRKLDYWIIGILAVAVVMLATNQFVVRRDATSVASAADAKALAAELAKLPQQSVAVLPLSNESGDPKQQYFSDGLSEELISELTQINGLKVIGRYSSFKFRDSRDTPAQIGVALGVANLIQGSVFQQGSRIRVTVGMIRAADGASVWSHSYDEQLNDVFAIKSKIGEAVAEALKIKLLGHAIVASDKPPSGNVEAYQFMLQGRVLTRRGTESDYRQGIALFQQALKLDPDYAFVWGLLSNASVNLGVGFLTGDARQQIYTQAREAADKEHELAPDAAFTHRDRGYLLEVVNNDPVGALAEYKRAHELAPNDATAVYFLAHGLATVGQLQPAAEMFRKAIAADPLRTGFYISLASVLLAQHQLDAAEQAIRKAPGSPGSHMILAEVGILRGDAAAAVRHAKDETDPVYGPWIRAMAQQIGQDRKQADAALHDYIAKNGKDQPYNVADLYALRKQPDEMFEWLQRAWTQRDPGFVLLTDPFLSPYQHDPRFAALCKQAGLPLPGQAVAGAARPGGA